LKYSIQRRALQIVIAVGGCVPVGAGILGIAYGPQWAGIASHAEAASHLRYLSGLLLAIGLLFWLAIPDIERRTTWVALLTSIVVTGGLARLAGVIFASDAATTGTVFSLMMELIVTPLVWTWQRRLAGHQS
jgi:hypothetical protein